MKGLFLILSLSVCGMFHPAMAQYRSEVWVSDEGNGMYRNPVLHADYSDPDVCVVGEDYFLTAPVLIAHQDCPSFIQRIW